RVSGTVGGSRLHGRLAFDFADPRRVDGAIETDAVSIPAMLGVALGAPPAKDAAWPKDPFIVSRSELSGRIAIKAQRAVLSPTLTAERMQGAIRWFGGSQVTFEDLQADLAGGR